MSAEITIESVQKQYEEISILCRERGDKIVELNAHITSYKREIKELQRVILTLKSHSEAISAIVELMRDL